jgi:hypothetical protein
MTTQEKLEHVRFQIKWYTEQREKNQLAIEGYRKLAVELEEILELDEEDIKLHDYIGGRAL